MNQRDRYNVTIYKGETFTTVVELKDKDNQAIDLTGATIVSSCRSKTSNDVVFSFVCTVNTPPTSGVFILSLPSSSSTNLSPTKNLVYDVKISWTNGETKFWLGGDVEVRDTVTQ